MNCPLPICALTLTVILFSFGCGSAHLIRVDDTGGEVVLSGMYISAASEARVRMAEHCNGPFAVYASSADGQPPRLIDTPNSDQRRAVFICVDAGEDDLAKGRR